MAYLRIPFMPGTPFLKYDPKDVPIIIGGFMFGPLSALLMSAVVAFIEMVTVSETGPIGLVMNFISSFSFTCTAALIYKHKRTLAGAMVGLVVACICVTSVMLLWNYIVTPLYTDAPRDVVARMLVPVFLPFNLIKSGLNAGIVMLIYKPVSMVLHRTGIRPSEKAAPNLNGKAKSKQGLNIGAILISLFVILTCVLIMLVLQGVI